MFFLRLISWIILVGLFFAAIFLKTAGGYILFVMFVFGAFTAVYEVLDMLEKIEYKSFKKISASAAAVLVAAAFIFAMDERYILIPFGLFVIGCWGYLLICDEKEKNMKKLIVSLSGSLLALVPIFFLAKIYNNNIGGLNIWLGPKLLLYLVVVTKIGDTFAYITGVLSNKIMKGKNHKIVPSISPKKSWEGTIGGMIFSIISSYFLYNYLFAENLLFLPLIAGVFLFWGGFFGDLAESALKRTCGVKDAGNIIPGMGGVCDLVDSFIFNAPLFYFIISF